MNPFSSAPLSRPASWQPSSSSTAVARPSAGAGAGVRRQLFIDDIDQAIDEDAKLKEQYPLRGLQHEELTALRRERDRLAPMCTDDAGAFELGPHLGERVTRILTAAVHGVGLAVADHQSQQVPPVSFHGHSLEMKRPFLEEEDDVVGPEAGDPLIVHVDPLAGVAASVKRQENLTAIGDLLHQQCRQARTEGTDSLMGVAPSAMDHGLTQQQIHDSWVGRDSRRGADLHAALGKGDSAAVMALMGSVKGAGLSPQQIGKLLAAKRSDGDPGLHIALQNGRASSVTAFMDGLKGAGLSPQRIGKILAAKRSDGITGLWFALQNGHATAVTAFMDGLKGAGLSPQQIPELLAAEDCYGNPGLYFALWHGHANAVTAFMDGLKGAGLSQQQIGKLLAAKDCGGASGLHLALQEGHAPAVTAYMDGLKGAGLSPQQIAEIVAAKDSHGRHGLHVAMRNGNAAAVTAYMNGLMDLQRHNLITAQQIDAIVSASGGGRV